MEKINEVKVVSNYDYERFEKEVNSFLSQGYVIHGQIQVTMTSPVLDNYIETFRSFTILMVK